MLHCIAWSFATEKGLEIEARQKLYQFNHTILSCRLCHPAASLPPRFPFSLASLHSTKDKKKPLEKASSLSFRNGLHVKRKDRSANDRRRSSSMAYKRRGTSALTSAQISVMISKAAYVIVTSPKTQVSITDTSVLTTYD